MVPLGAEGIMHMIIVHVYDMPQIVSNKNLQPGKVGITQKQLQLGDEKQEKCESLGVLDEK